jgi:organic hydroperoxide reductase OsmC/OhrA
MPKFPLKFEVTAKATSGIGKSWTIQEGSQEPVNCAIPPDFHGPGGAYSPEGLFGAAITSCIIAVFKVLTDKSNISFATVDGKAMMTMDFITEDYILSITEVDFIFDITGASDIDKAKSLMGEAIKTCPISNSIKCGKTYNINVN